MMEGEKSRTNSNTDLVVDRISFLPNSILGDILSFLPTEEAVATSVLSKRWKFAWVAVHNLDFYYYDPELEQDSAENMKFVGFVHRVLLLIDAVPLNKFSLNCHSSICSHVICWIDAAIKRNVRELYLYIGDGDDILKLPISGFNCDSLQSLEVHNFTLVFHDATVVWLPRLESLKLDHVHFTSKEACEKLVSGCPMLHYLKLAIYFRDDADDDDCMCIISSVSLKRLEIIFRDVSRLKLKASSLEYLKLRGCISEIFVERSLCSLVQADFGIRLVKHDPLRLDEYDLLNSSIIEAVRAFEHAKFLILSVDVMRALGRATISLSTEFKRLVKLVAGTYCCCVQDFIHNSESLEVLIIYQDYCTNDPHNHSRWTAPVEVLRCLSNSLVKGQVDGYNGLEDEREMIRYMLEHGSVLEVMQISCSSKEDVEKLELLQDICEFPRKSPACKVQFRVWPTKREFKSPIPRVASDTVNISKHFLAYSYNCKCNSVCESNLTVLHLFWLQPSTTYKIKLKYFGIIGIQ